MSLKKSKSLRSKDVSGEVELMAQTG
jgi:hypothetical protein